MATIWDKLAEGVRQLDEPFRRSEIVGWFRRHHPEVNEASLAAHIQSAVHGVSRGAFANRPPLLERIHHGLYRRYRGAEVASPRATAARGDVASTGRTQASTAPDLVLVSCSNRKMADAAPAAQLYLGMGFAKATAYATRLGAPWYVLSARYGLLAPEDVVGPYDVTLSDQSTGYRTAWGRWVTAQLVELVGSLDGLAVEVHAGDAYAAPLREPLRRSGAFITEPLAGLTQGRRLAWYGHEYDDASSGPDTDGDDSIPHLLEALRSHRLALAVDRLPHQPGLRRPGLYAWWVDEEGAADLSDGLGHVVRQGLIYAGLAGATRWPSGRRSTNTLHGRLVGMHLGKRSHLSTFRLSLAAILSPLAEWEGIDEPALTRWMAEHLRVVAVPYVDADGLGRVESALLAQLDPPLNLRGMPPTPLRQRLSTLRRELGVR